MDIAGALIKASRRLVQQCALIEFPEDINLIYNPLEYAAAPYEEYLTKFAATPKKNIFIGINPGPWGMVQTGIPFGEVNAVKNYLKIKKAPQTPMTMNPVLPILGQSCSRAEVSGKRLWGLIAATFPQADDFFAENLVFNYCPLFFSRVVGPKRENVTPDKLPREIRTQLYAPCDEFLIQTAKLLRPKFLIGVGGFAHKRLTEIFPDSNYIIDSITHPSPLNARANKNFFGLAGDKLRALGAWPAS